MNDEMYYDRRTFIKMGSVLAMAPIIPTNVPERKYKRKLAFSTIGCPDWSFEQILQFGQKSGFDGIEFRGIQRELDLTRTKPFQTTESVRQSKVKMEAAGLKPILLAASARLHIKDPVAHSKEMDEAKRFIDLAAALDCPYIRVFPDKFFPGEEKKETLDRIVNGLLQLGDYAKETQVKVLLETHGEVVRIADLLYIMKASSHPAIGMLWDYFNMWVVTNESPAEAYRQLAPYIDHIQIKDGNRTEKGYKLTLVGHGNAPLREALTALEAGRYNGYYSLEWEKLWHPELPDPNIAFADYSKFMKDSEY